jgi:hypothetical protein
MKKCKEENCGGKHKARGLCHKHYQRLLATGVERIRKLTGTLEERFHRCYAVNEETGCHEWTYSMHVQGYPLLCYQNKILKAHRLSYQLHKGDIPHGMQICHTCDNTRCVNPDHLFAGTQRDNNLDRHSKGRTRGSVLTRHHRVEIFYLFHCEGKTLPYLAGKFNVTPSSIHASLRRFKQRLERSHSLNRKSLKLAAYSR